MRTRMRTTATLMLMWLVAVVGLAVNPVPASAQPSGAADEVSTMSEEPPPPHIPSTWGCEYFNRDEALGWESINVRCWPKSNVTADITASLWSSPLGGTELRVTDDYRNGLATRAYLRVGDSSSSWGTFRSYGARYTYDLASFTGEYIELMVCSSAKSNAACSRIKTGWSAG